jgi:aminomethyltransferase
VPVSPLNAGHERRGARFTDFGGWTMPVQYEGVLAEHMAVRDGVGVFDVSHLGRFSVRGAGAVDLVRRQLCNDITTIAPGRAQYTMALNEHAGVEDDIIVWWIDDDTLWVMPNGTNYTEILERFREDAPGGVDVEPIRESTALIAVQGPEARPVLEAVLGAAPKRFRVDSGRFDGVSYLTAGTGYTGERGGEVAVPAAAGESLFDAFLEAGAAPCGLGARDTLRLEMGFPLWGQDLDETTTPLEAGLGWVVNWDHEFIGREALAVQRETGIARSLIGFRTEGRAIPRPGYRIRTQAAEGTVTSGNFSPVLECGIGMGYLSPVPEGGTVEVDIRDRWVEAAIVDPPFVAR